MLKGKDILGIKNMPVEEIEFVLKTAAEIKEGWKTQEGIEEQRKILKGKTMINLFFENSTRTRTSFELSGKRLGVDVINVSIATSSVKKGESLMDTAKTLDAMNIDAYVIRHSNSGAPAIFSEYVKGSVINAGDGANEHPTQAFLDCFTILERLGSLKGKKVAIVGDVLHSRVARSNIYMLKKLGAEVTLAGPETLLFDEFRNFGVKVTHNIDDIIEDADVINILRLQLERQSSGFLPSLKEYNSLYGISNKRLARAKESVIIMHPGPMNRGVEIDYDVADCDKQFILEQVENGVAVRMALLYLILRGKN